MIFLRANTELKNTFERLIQTMKVPVEWNGIFAVLNNFLILPGEVRSLIFNFDNRRVNTNVIEIPVEEQAVQPIEKMGAVTNVLNMVLYAFGKWETISGLKVEKDYAQLNKLFTEILLELKIEPEYRNDTFRFFKKGIQITYEDVMQAAIEEGQKEQEEEAEEEEKLGLWHNMCWVTGRASFAKDTVTAVEQETARIGNNFYQVGYKCPECGKKLYMVVYPVDKEFPVETEEGKVYLARAYACDTCNCFYTPRPGKLLSEGDIYILDFEEDREAYEDYQELLGKQGEKTSNYKFNEYEWERNGKKASEEETVEEEINEENELSAESAEEEFAEKQNGERESKEFHESPRVQDKEIQKEKQRQSSGVKKENRENSRKEEAEVFQKKSREVLQREKVSEEFIKNPENSREKFSREQKKETQKKSSVEIPEAHVREKYNARMKVIERMSKRQLQELRENIRKENLLSEPEKSEYIENVEKNLRKLEEAQLQKLEENAQKGNYIQMCRIIEEIEKSDCPQDRKEPVLARLHEMKQKKAQSEAEELIAHMPASMDRKKYQLFRDKLEQYKEADITPYEERLRAQKELAERQEIENMMRRAGRNDRGALYRIWQRLQEPDFAKENTKKPLEELYRRIHKLDEEAIERICPDIMTMTFEEGREACEKISSGMFLPEIKSNALEMIDKRLIKMKSDESEMLVRKLQEELKGKIKDASSLHYNDARKAMMGEWKGTEADIVNCAVNTYASEHGKYEYPILVCDSTRKGTGREGFLLTPDHLFYNSAFSSECISIFQIKNVSFSTGVLNKGIYIHRKNGEKTKIPAGLHGRDFEAFTRVFREFIGYLQEKPESRKISYLAKEEHEVKCCYRCGYVYKGGDICPKCGNRANK